MIYPGDTYVFTLSLATPTGADPGVTVAPHITVLDAVSGVALVAAAAMNLLAGTSQLYTYGWQTATVPAGTYVAVVSYATAGATVNNVFLERVRLGDTFVTGPVALDATVAHESTVAHDATVLKLSDYMPAANDPAVRAIQAKTDLLPNDPVSTAFLNANVVAPLADVRDSALGAWINDLVNHVLTMRRVSGQTLATFNVSNDGVTSARIPQA